MDNRDSDPLLDPLFPDAARAPQPRACSPHKVMQFAWNRRFSNLPFDKECFERLSPIFRFVSQNSASLVDKRDPDPKGNKSARRSSASKAEFLFLAFTFQDKNPCIDSTGQVTTM
jgi:hypothetical protein